MVGKLEVTHGSGRNMYVTYDNPRGTQFLGECFSYPYRCCTPKEQIVEMFKELNYYVKEQEQRKTMRDPREELLKYV